MTTYAGRRSQLVAAQETLDTHVPSSPTGRCRSCGSPEPCVARETAAALFELCNELPLRRPGASLPVLSGSSPLGQPSSIWATTPC